MLCSYSALVWHCCKTLLLHFQVISSSQNAPFNLQLTTVQCAVYSLTTYSSDAQLTRGYMLCAGASRGLQFVKNIILILSVFALGFGGLGRQAAITTAVSFTAGYLGDSMLRCLTYAVAGLQQSLPHDAFCSVQIERYGLKRTFLFKCRRTKRFHTSFFPGSVVNVAPRLHSSMDSFRSTSTALPQPKVPSWIC